MADRGAAGAGVQRSRRARLKNPAVSDKPAPIDIQGVRDEDLIDLSPEIHKQAIDIVAKYDHGALFTPPSERGTIQVPGVAGGGNWAGAAIDPETGMFYVGTIGCRSSLPSASRHRASRHTISSANSAICRDRADCRCSSRRSAVSLPST